MITEDIELAAGLIARAEDSLHEARANATRRSGYVNRSDPDYVPALLESIAASLLAIAKRL